jgi:PTH1 family peptidyl-tRNA hydrolase
MSVSVIAGLGNPGEKYASTRHNVGYWLLGSLASAYGVSLKAEKKVMGDVCQTSIAHSNVRLLRPSTYMNESGQSVRRMLDFYKLDVEQLLVIHDELDLPPGTVRLKRGGGHGGHNGLRDILSHCGKDFLRLRIGIGHPGDKSQVTGYVLRAPESAEQRLIEDSLPDAGRAIEILLADGLEKAMHFLHTDSQP